MKEFKDDAEKIKFLIPIISRYRIFIAKYIGVHRSQVIQIMSRRLNKPEEQCHLRQITTIEACNEMIKALKEFKYELTGSKRLPEKVNLGEYVKKLKNNIS